ncbi:hypothetical protein GCM10009740_08130 [Terrabacter terrae]|uniref:Uncharacterized protein n=1 Tax=Terrabacter terrae TaxID=318434 RepID=A0ABN2TV64_9MICO
MPTAARAPARRAAGIAVDGLVGAVADLGVGVVVVLGGASGLTPAVRSRAVDSMVTRSGPGREDPRRWRRTRWGGCGPCGGLLTDVREPGPAYAVTCRSDPGAAAYATGRQTRERAATRR